MYNLEEFTEEDKNILNNFIQIYMPDVNDKFKYFEDTFTNALVYSTALKLVSRENMDDPNNDFFKFLTIRTYNSTIRNNTTIDLIIKNNNPIAAEIVFKNGANPNNVITCTKEYYWIHTIRAEDSDALKVFSLRNEYIKHFTNLIKLTKFFLDNFSDDNSNLTLNQIGGLRSYSLLKEKYTTKYLKDIFENRGSLEAAYKADQYIKDNILTVLGIVKDSSNLTVADPLKPSLLDLPKDMLTHILSFVSPHDTDFNKPIGYINEESAESIGILDTLPEVDCTGLITVLDNLTI